MIWENGFLIICIQILNVKNFIGVKICFPMHTVFIRQDNDCGNCNFLCVFYAFALRINEYCHLLLLIFCLHFYFYMLFFCSPRAILRHRFFDHYWTKVTFRYSQKTIAAASTCLPLPREDNVFAFLRLLVVGCFVSYHSLLYTLLMFQSRIICLLFYAYYLANFLLLLLLFFILHNLGWPVFYNEVEIVPWSPCVTTSPL